MDQNNRLRPGQGVPKERPRTPAARPKNSRPRSGTAAQREAERAERATRREPEPSPARTRTQSPAGSREPVRRSPAPEREQGSPERRRTPQNAPSRKPRRSTAPNAAKPRGAAPQAAPKRKKKKPHRVYNTNFGFKFVTMLAVVAVIVLSMVIFFKVKHIQVLLPEAEDGQIRSYYTEAEIIEASGIHLDENLLSLSKATVASRIHAALPYVNEIQIKKQLPGTVVISFSEFSVSYAIQDLSGSWWLMSREGRILEAADEQELRDHMTITGMSIQTPQPGDWFKPAAAEGADMSEIAAKQKVVLDLIPALEQTSFSKEIVRADVSTSYDLTLWYGTRYEIRLGTTEELDYKLRTLAAILNNSEIQRKSGTIDLTFTEDSKAHFLEFR